LPQMARVRQAFEHHKIDDVAEAVTNEMGREEIKAKVKPGAKIAVGVGSRGVANIDVAVKALIASLKELGADPFIFPAMGSHAGGTSEGQEALLAGYGVTENKMGAPVRATMDTVVVAELEGGTKVHMDKYAHDADGVVLINRVKPHTSFRGEIESGIVKMMTIGMGKINGATSLHGNHPITEFGDALPRAAKAIMECQPFLFGIGMVEDAFDDTAIIRALPAETLFAEETKLQARAKELMAKIYIEDIDVLVIDEIGKEISGAGADPNVIGNPGTPGFEVPRVKKIVILDLTEKTHGNAAGIGSAHVITHRLLRRVDFASTYANMVTATALEGARVPIPMKTAEDAVRLAVKTLIGVEPEDARIVRIRNTLSLGEIEVSEPILKELQGDSRMEVLSQPGKISFADAA
ncbi:MAG: lactate racemase domain-containing protein, partial [Pseudomonadota bacterium]|nr:lactate racemase domain-containing protein [Pseudomonadota bacterium]